MKTKDELLDALTEQYKISEEQCNCAENSEQERFFAAVMCNAYAQAFARLHTSFYPTIPDGAGAMVVIRSDVSLAAMQTISLPVGILKRIAAAADKQGLEDDLVHLVTDNELLTAHLIEPHLDNRAKQIACCTSIYNIQ